MLRNRHLPEKEEKICILLKNCDKDKVNIIELCEQLKKNENKIKYLNIIQNILYIIRNEHIEKYVKSQKHIYEKYLSDFYTTEKNTDFFNFIKIEK